MRNLILHFWRILALCKLGAKDTNGVSSLTATEDIDYILLNILKKSSYWEATGKLHFIYLWLSKIPPVFNEQIFYRLQIIIEYTLVVWH